MTPPDDQTWAMAGIGGTGMLPLALLAREQGHTVYGWDDALGPQERHLLQRNAIRLPRHTDLPPGTRRLIRSSAVHESHPLVRQAWQRDLPVDRRGHALARLIRHRALLAVVGSHGKSTVTALLSWLARAAGEQIGYFVGGRFRGDLAAPARLGSGPWFIAEVDESDGTWEAFHPSITLALNYDFDHHARYPEESLLQASWQRLFARTRRSVLIPARDPALPLLARHAKVPVAAWDTSARWNVRSLAGGIRVCDHHAGTEVNVPLLGAFNARNVRAALAAAEAIGLDHVVHHWEGFPHLHRRQVVHHATESLTVIEDYAHHPTEITALLHAMRESLPARALVCVYQPHRYSRTAALKAELARALSAADHLFLLPVYGAGEVPHAGGTTEDLRAAFPEPPPVLARPASFAPLQRLLDQRPSILLFAGAGDIGSCAQAFLGGLTAPPSIAIERRSRRAIFREKAPSVREYVPLAPRTTMGTGGTARFFAEPASAAELAQLLQRANAASLPVFLLGRGSNLLVPDDGYAGLVISLSHPAWRRIDPLGEARLRVGAGARVMSLAGRAGNLGIAGFEFLEGIPGTLGGALRMNAGAMGSAIFDRVRRVRVLSMQGEERLLERDAFQPRYRTCTELEGLIVLEAELEGTHARADREELRALRACLAARRRQSQPREPSAGCVFKNPASGFAGKLIDELGMKGARIGAAEVSALHANFIVNRGGASCRDVIDLIRRIHESVRERCGTALEPEVQLLGKRWEEVL